MRVTDQNSELIAGRYQLVELIGQGGMGRVWRGVDQQLFGREVAIKEIRFPVGLDDGDRAMLLRRFTDEARAAVTLSHPGIITIHDVVEHRGAPVIVMEFIRGQSLAAAIRRHGRLPAQRVAEIGSAMLDALAEAHAARIVHRDIKPDNVLLTKDRVVLTDFGIAHLADATTRLSHSGIVIGTPHYMPPEQLEGKRPTPTNDLWALGATLYHAVEGRLPFDAEGIHALAVAVFTRPHQPPVHAGPLAPVLDALLTKDPARRPEIAEVAELLASALQASGPRTGATAEADQPVPVPRPVPDPAPAPAPAPDPASVPGEPREHTSTPREHTPTPTEHASLPTEHASLPVEQKAELPPRPPQQTPTVRDSPSAPHSPRRPEPNRPAPKPVPLPTTTSEEVVALGGRGDAGDAGGATTRRHSVTRRSTVLAVAVATLTVGSVLAWTFNRDDLPGGDGAAGKGSPASPVTVVIGVDAPLSGALSPLGVGIRNSADLAARTANRTRHVPGVNFKIKALDDESSPAEGAPNAARFVADEEVLGVVGPLNSAVARTMGEPLAQANLVNVSPANTSPGLTLGPHWAEGTKSRPYKTYFRTVASDVAQGPFAARYLHGEIGRTKLYVIDDGGDYGTTLTSGFTAEFTKLGGAVVGTEQVDPAEADFAGLAARVRSSGAEAVYFGGYYTTAAPLSRQLKQAGLDIPLMGGDGMFDQQFLATNPNAEGDLATNIGVPAESLAGGGEFLARYRKAGYSEEAGSYGPYAYDSAWAVIEAVKDVVATHGSLPKDARAKMPQAVAGLRFDGVTGRVAFDEYGDTVDPQLTVYEVESGNWTTMKSGSLTP